LCNAASRRNGIVFIVIGAIKKVADHMVRSGFATFLIYMVAAALAFGVGFGLLMLFNPSLK